MCLAHLVYIEKLYDWVDEEYIFATSTPRNKLFFSAATKAGASYSTSMISSSALSSPVSSSPPKPPIGRRSSFGEQTAKTDGFDIENDGENKAGGGLVWRKGSVGATCVPKCVYVLAWPRSRFVIHILQRRATNDKPTRQTTNINRTPQHSLALPTTYQAWMQAPVYSLSPRPSTWIYAECAKNSQTPLWQLEWTIRRGVSQAF